MPAILIVLGNMVTGFGNSVYLVALLVAASRFAPGPINIALIQASAYLPVFVLSIWGGGLADRINRGGIIAGTDIARTLFLAAAGIALSRFGNSALMPVVLPLVLANAAMQALFTPAIISLSLDLQRSRGYKLDLLSLRTAGGHLASLAGQILGGLLSMRYGLVTLLYANGAVFLASGISELWLIGPARHVRLFTGNQVLKERISTGLASLFAELRSAHERGAPLSLYLAFQVSAAFIVVSLPTFLSVRLGLAAEYMGLCLAALLGGSILSALVMSGPGSRWPLEQQKALARSALLVAAAAAAGASFLGRAIIWPLAVLLLVSGMSAGYLHIVTLHLVYRLGESASAARRQGAVEAAATGSIFLGYLAGGILATALAGHIEWMFRLAALFLLAVALIRRKGK